MKISKTMKKYMEEEGIDVSELEAFSEEHNCAQIPGQLDPEPPND